MSNVQSSNSLSDKSEQIALTWRGLLIRMFAGYVLIGVINQIFSPFQTGDKWTAAQKIVGSAISYLTQFVAVLVATSFIAVLISRVPLWRKKQPGSWSTRDREIPSKLLTNQSKPLPVLLNRALFASLLVCGIVVYGNWYATKKALKPNSMKMPTAVSVTSNFVLVRLPQGVTIELPRNWTVLSDNQRITLDSWVQVIRERGGSSNFTSDFPFAANYFDDQGNTAAVFNIRYNPKQAMTQAKSSSVTIAEMKELDEALRSGISVALQQSGLRVHSWMGTTKQSINGIIAFVTEYRYSAIRESAPFHAWAVKIFDGSRSFTIGISFREDQEYLLKPICDHIIQSIRI